MTKFGPKHNVFYYSESRLMLSLVNVINRLMWSHLIVPFNKVYYIKTSGYFYHSVNVITFGLAKVITLSGLQITYHKLKKNLTPLPFLTFLTNPNPCHKLTHGSNCFFYNINHRYLQSSFAKKQPSFVS